MSTTSTDRTNIDRNHGVIEAAINYCKRAAVRPDVTLSQAAFNTSDEGRAVTPNGCTTAAVLVSLKAMIDDIQS